MGDKTAIEWTDATWNPVRGCSIVSKGCTNCYAMKQAHRSSGAGGAYEGLTKLTKGGPVWTGEVTIVTSQLSRPIFWRRPRRIFVNSMSDLFHEGLNDGSIDEIFAVMAIADHHQYQVLTKRPQRMLHYLTDPQRIQRIYDQWSTYSGKAPEIKAWPLPNVWLGVSVEDQAAADERIPLLLQAPASVRWISAEPLLGPIDIRVYLDKLQRYGMRQQTPCLDWIVAGGESGPGARPMHPDWTRSLRDQCAAAGVAFFFKQWGSWTEVDGAHRDPDTGDHRQIEVPSHEASDSFDAATDCLIAADGRVFRKLEDLPADVLCRQMARGPKKLCGRELDGRTHDEYPA